MFQTSHPGGTVEERFDGNGTGDKTGKDRGNEIDNWQRKEQIQESLKTLVRKEDDFQISADLQNYLTEVLFINLEGTGKEEHILRGKMISFEISDFGVMVRYIFLSIRWLSIHGHY